MGRSWAAVVTAVFMTLEPAQAQEQARHLTERRATMTIGGRSVAHHEGVLKVPARTAVAGDQVTIAFKRFRAERATDANAIFLLAGGPGDSLIDRLETPRGASELTFLRTVADVVIFDQRGAGRSRPRPTCSETAQLPADRVVTQAERGAALRRLAEACRARVTADGADLSIFTTPASGDDIERLRAALGYDRISLVAGSYGSHLAIDYMRRYPKRIGRAMLRGLEGPDHTWDMPSGVLAALRRIAEDAEADPALRPHIPVGGLVAALATVRDRLAKAPRKVAVDGDSIVLGADDVRAAATLGANRSGEWPGFVIALHRGDYDRLARHALARRTVRISDPMYHMMDCASGITAPRAARIVGDPARALLGNINLGYDSTCAAWGAPDLGDAFRRDLRSDIPVLLFQGDWDTSTPLENGREVAAGLRNVIRAEVGRAGHPTFDELYGNWPPMRDVVRTFLTGGTPRVPARIELPRVAFPLVAAERRP